MSGISTHVLDQGTGRPAAGVAIRLDRQESDGGWTRIGGGTTDANGRIAALLDDGASIVAAPHRLVFDTGAWFRARNQPVFYPEVVVHFLPEAGAHYHVPLLLAPFGYSTYRGS